MPACTDAIVEDRLDKLLNELQNLWRLRELATSKDAIDLDNKIAYFSSLIKNLDFHIAK